ncbi:MAG: hypothetical protein NT127_03920 [Sphingobacteriales bacterium]|nr:hypothetical protein [Sphingobacteriales bacterium]
MKLKISFALMLFFYCSCLKHTSNKNAYLMLNQNFTQLVDTISYKYNTLRPTPNQLVLDEKRTTYPISVFYKFMDINKWDDLIIEALKTDSIRNRQSFLDLYYSNKHNEPEEIDILKINKSGRYKLHKNKNIDTRKIDGFVGHVKFSTIIEDGRFGLFVITIQDNLKSGVEKLILLEQTNNCWKISQEIELTVW